MLRQEDNCHPELAQQDPQAQRIEYTHCIKYTDLKLQSVSMVLSLAWWVTLPRGRGRATDRLDVDALSRQGTYSETSGWTHGRELCNT